MISRPCPAQGKGFVLSRRSNSEGEHAPEMGHTVCSVLFVRVDDDLGVGAGREAVPEIQQGLPDVLVVVNLAIENDPDGTVLI